MSDNFLLFVLILIILLLISIVRFDQEQLEKKDKFVCEQVDCKRYQFLCTDKVEKWEYQPYFREQTIGIKEVAKVRRYN